MDVDIALGSGEAAHLVDLTIMPDIVLPGFAPFGNVFVRSGTVVFENCTITGAGDGQGTVNLADASVVFRRCRISGRFGANALFARNSDVVAIDSELTGQAASTGNPSSRGLTALGSGSLHLSNCRVIGGDGASAPDPGPSVGAWVDVDAWIIGSWLEGGDGAPATPGAVGLRAGSMSSVSIARTTVQGGVGPGVGPGRPTAGPVQVDPALLGASFSPAVATLGAPSTASWTAAAAGTSVAVFLAAGDLAVPIRLEPLISQPIWATQLDMVGQVTTAANRRAELQFSVPNDPTLRFRSFALLGFALDGLRVQGAPPLTLTIR